ncbi:YqkE family protein [Paenibacillus senegalensis]|uniref:YqkE family protein n=1 Tax=Paenibacillus senegalensis TaxID=1465766 RepID=UPI000287AA1E|nr:YqkE family protein [Paenibacillus senegalensis]
MPNNKAAQGRSVSGARPEKRTAEDQPTLKDRLDPGVIQQLKAKAADLKEQEEAQERERKRQAAEARKAELKRLENDFEHLLKTSNLNWKKFK